MRISEALGDIHSVELDLPLDRSHGEHVGLTLTAWQTDFNDGPQPTGKHSISLVEAVALHTFLTDHLDAITDYLARSEIMQSIDEFIENEEKALLNDIIYDELGGYECELTQRLGGLTN